MTDSSDNGWHWASSVTYWERLNSLHFLHYCSEKSQGSLFIDIFRITNMEDISCPNHTKLTSLVTQISLAIKTTFTKLYCCCKSPPSHLYIQTSENFFSEIWRKCHRVLIFEISCDVCSNLWGYWAPRYTREPRLAASAGRPEEGHTVQPKCGCHLLVCSGLPLSRRWGGFPHISARDRWARDKHINYCV